MGAAGSTTPTWPRARVPNARGSEPKAVRFTAAMRAGVERQLTKSSVRSVIVGLAEREGRDKVSHERIYQHVAGQETRRDLA